MTTNGQSDEPSAVLDRLNAECLAAPGEIEPQIRLWTAVAALDQWILINRGSTDSPRPYALAAEAGNMVCIFSSPERAQAAAVTAGLVAADASVELIAVSLPGALDWLMSLGEHGVAGVTVDHPVIGAWTPLANLSMLRQDPTSSS
ncbi:hypothetical protein [Labedella endophytica]|uniref:SseB family protein n=1 Tax=Labedella endophytica TaxID=1523160 RepID=A0A433JP88_9MICO|nr:hypothetical protein [Labedella endophytica]RUQ98280.1 hypothetical protein ELQ94_14850 [Labedella endophytica]